MSTSSAVSAIPSPTVSSSSTTVTTSTDTTFNTVTEPLTTLYTPPADCKSRLWTSASSTNGTLVVSHSVAAQPSCYPPEYLGQTRYIAYSPGVCPVGWTAQSSWTFGPVATSICCPSGMKNTLNSECASWLDAPATIALDDDHTTTITSRALAFEWFVIAEWASSDLDTFTPRDAPLLTAGAAVPSSTPVRSPPAKSTPQPSQTSPAKTHTAQPSPNSRSSLSTGEKAGIGVGAAAAALLVIGILAFLLLRSKKRKQHVQNANYGGAAAYPPGEPTYHNYHQTAQARDQRASELYAPPMSQMPHKGSGGEVHSPSSGLYQVPYSPASELPASPGR